MSTNQATSPFPRTPTDEHDAYLQERYRLIREDLGPFKMASGPKLVVHLLPSGDQWPTTSKSGVKRLPEQGMVPHLQDVRGGGARMTFDGRAFYLADGDAASAVTHVLHNGIVEAVMGLINEHAPADYKGVSLNLVEQCTTRYVSEAVDNGLAERITGLPCIVRLALLDTQAHHASANGETSPRMTVGLPVRQSKPVLVVPDVHIQNDEQVVESLLPPAFDRMWQAWGYNGTPNYREDGAGVWRKAS